LDKIRLGLVGCGAGASALYGDFFQYLENGELVACMDVVKENAEKLAAQTGATKVYTELESLLDDKEIDAVIIITPTNLHADQVVKAAQAKKHIYCEKPMTTTIGEADRMISACKENNVKLQIAFMKRFNKSFHLVDLGQCPYTNFSTGKLPPSIGFRGRILAGGWFPSNRCVPLVHGRCGRSNRTFDDGCCQSV